MIRARGFGRRTAFGAASIFTCVLAVGSNIRAQTPDSGEEVEVVDHGSGGQTEVNYYGNGGLTSETRIPTSSAFHTTGRGSVEAATPCLELYWDESTQVTAPPPSDPTVSTVPPSVLIVPHQYISYRWTYREISEDEISGDWSPEIQGQLGELEGIGSMFGYNLRSTITMAQSYHARNAPLETAVRRFWINCKVPRDVAERRGLSLDEYGEHRIGSVEVGMTDPFWNPLSRLGILWGMIQLPSYRVIAPPEVNTYGGLVVNMPTWLQIEATAWRPYFTDVDEHMGWTSQLGLFPSELRFEVVGSGGGTIPCGPAESEARGGAIPGAPDDLPRYYELGQLGEDCVWVPQERGPVTVRARISYDVLLTVSGYSEWLSPYVWYSDPLTLPVEELRVRNVTPEGGIGE